MEDGGRARTQKSGDARKESNGRDGSPEKKARRRCCGALTLRFFRRKKRQEKDGSRAPRRCCRQLLRQQWQQCSQAHARASGLGADGLDEWKRRKRKQRKQRKQLEQPEVVCHRRLCIDFLFSLSCFHRIRHAVSALAPPQAEEVSRCAHACGGGEGEGAAGEEAKGERDWNLGFRPARFFQSSSRLFFRFAVPPPRA